MCFRKFAEIWNRPWLNIPYWFPIGQVEMLQWSIYHHVMHPMMNDAKSIKILYFLILKYSNLIGCSTYPSIGCFSHWNIFIGMMFFEQIAHFVDCIEMFNFPVTVTINLSKWPWMTFDLKWPLTLSKPPHSFWDMLNLPYSIELSDSMSNLYFPVSIPPPSGEYA